MNKENGSGLPLVTINIPAYRQEKYIARAIQSAVAQDYPNLQVIVPDDCSPDDTFEVARAFASNKVQVHKTPRNLGRVGNYHHLLYHLSAGDWVVNLDGDDFYSDPTFISTAINLVTKHPSAVMYAAGASSIDEERGRITASPIKLAGNVNVVKGTDYVLNFYKWGQIGQHFSVLYNRKLALETNFYILDSLGADTDSICRLALKGDVIIHKKYVGVWTSHKGNASYSLNIRNVQKEFAMLESIAGAAYQYLPRAVVDRWLKESKQLKYKQSLYNSLPNEKFKEALVLLLKNWTWEVQSFKEVVKIFLRLI